jgi:hypothetical protein
MLLKKTVKVPNRLILAFFHGTKVENKVISKNQEIKKLKQETKKLESNDDESNLPTLEPYHIPTPNL